MILFLETKFIRERDQWNVVDASVTSHICCHVNDLKPSLFSHRGTIRTCPSPSTDTIRNSQPASQPARQINKADPIGWIVNSNSPSTQNLSTTQTQIVNKVAHWYHPYLLCENVCIHDIHHLLIRTGQIGTDLLYQPLFSCHTRVAVTVLKEGGQRSH